MATYYVDSSALTGNDTNNGLAPVPGGTGVGPWQTFQAVNAHVFVPGDVILFKRGGVWNYTLNPMNSTLLVTVSGTSTNPITWGAYGTGANPVFSGFVDTGTSWAQTPGENIWTYNNGGFPALISSVRILTINGTPQGYGRFPKSGYNTYTAFTFSTSSTTITLTDPGLGSPTGFNPGEVVIRKTHSTLTRATVNSVASNLITCTTAATSPISPANNYGYFFQNSMSCLTHQGDWCYDGSGNIVMYSLAKPTGVKVGIVDRLINFPTPKNYNVFNNISFEGANQAGIDLNYGGIGNKVDSCQFNNMGNYGILMTGANTCTVSNNTVTDTMSLAILLTDAISNTVLNNVINRSGQIAGMGQSTDGTTTHGAYSGMVVGYATTASGNTVNNNTVLSCGSSGITVLGDGFTCNGNYVNTCCSILDDGGGIYTAVGTSGSFAYTNRRTISNNTVINSIGAPDGTADLKIQSYGIYLDDNSSYYSVIGNTVTQCAAGGLFFHNNYWDNTKPDQKNMIINNVAYNNGICQLEIQHDPNTTNNPQPIGFVIQNNTFMVNSLSQLWFWIRMLGSTDTATTFQTLGVIDNNTYITFFTNVSLFKTELPFPAGATTQIFSAWQTYTTAPGAATTDANSVVNLYQVTDQLPTPFSLQSPYDITNAVL